MTPCTISLSPSSDLLLSIPSPSGGEQTVVLPMSMDGLRLLKKVLREQASRSDRRLGTSAEPTQHMIEIWLREDREKKFNERFATIAKEIDLEI